MHVPGAMPRIPGASCPVTTVQLVIESTVAVRSPGPRSGVGRLGRPNTSRNSHDLEAL